MSDPFAAQRLDGKVLVVTGSTQGLGAAIATRAARLGAGGIVVCGRDPARGERVRGELAELGCEAVFASGDLAEPEQCREIIRTCGQCFGRLDGLVHAAGLSARGRLDDTSIELWDRLFAVNVRAPFLLNAGRRSIDAPRHGRQHRQHHHHGQPRRRADSHRLFGAQGRTGGPDAQRRLPAAAGPHPGQRPEHRVDRHGGRARGADGHRPAGRLAGDSRGGRPFGRLLRPDDIAPMVTYLLSDAEELVTGSVIDFDQTVHGPLGDHVAPVAAQAEA